MGGSAGGYLVAATTYLGGPDDPHDDLAISPAPTMVVLFNPVLNGEPGSYLAPLVGDRAVALSPFLHIQANSPPVLMLSGQADEVVGVDDIVDFARRLKRAGIPAELLLYRGQKHGFFNYGNYVLSTNLSVDRFLVARGMLLPKGETPEPDPLPVTARLTQ